MIYHLILALLNTPRKLSRFRAHCPSWLKAEQKGHPRYLFRLCITFKDKKRIGARSKSGGRFSHAPSHFVSVECFPLHTFIFCTSFHERSKKTEAIAFCCAARECNALSRAMFDSNGKQESSGIISPMPALKRFFGLIEPSSSKFWQHFENQGLLHLARDPAYQAVELV
jgi:hypothetical protein